MFGSPSWKHLVTTDLPACTQQTHTLGSGYYCHFSWRQNNCAPQYCPSIFGSMQAPVQMPTFLCCTRYPRVSISLTRASMYVSSVTYDDTSVSTTTSTFLLCHNIRPLPKSGRPEKVQEWFSPCSALCLSLCRTLIRMEILGKMFVVELMLIACCMMVLMVLSMAP